MRLTRESKTLRETIKISLSLSSSCWFLQDKSACLFSFLLINTTDDLWYKVFDSHLSHRMHTIKYVSPESHNQVLQFKTCYDTGNFFFVTFFCNWLVTFVFLDCSVTFLFLYLAILFYLSFSFVFYPSLFFMLTLSEDLGRELSLGWKGLKSGSTIQVCSDIQMLK